MDIDNVHQWRGEWGGSNGRSKSPLHAKRMDGAAPSVLALGVAATRRAGRCRPGLHVECAALLLGAGASGLELGRPGRWTRRGGSCRRGRVQGTARRRGLRGWAGRAARPGARAPGR
jgi:hypothetical protein